MSETTKFTILDEADVNHNAYVCKRCWDIVQFETGDPYENGMDYCPHCGRMVIHPELVEEMLG